MLTILQKKLMFSFLLVVCLYHSQSWVVYCSVVPTLHTIQDPFLEFIGQIPVFDC